MLDKESNCSFNEDPNTTSLAGNVFAAARLILAVSISVVNLFTVRSCTYLLVAIPAASPGENPLHMLGVRLSSAVRRFCLEVIEVVV